MAGRRSFRNATALTPPFRRDALRSGRRFDADRDDRDERARSDLSGDANRGRGGCGAVGDHDPEAVGASLGGAREERDEAWVDAGGFREGGVVGTVPFDREGFFLGHRALGPAQGGGTYGHGLRGVDDQPQGDGLIGRVVGGDADGLFLPDRASADGEFDAHRAGLTGGEERVADRSGEAIAGRTQRGEVQRLRAGVTKGEFRDRFFLTGCDAEFHGRARPRHGGFAANPDQGGQGSNPQRERAGGWFFNHG
jgi:hypothetical protein